MEERVEQDDDAFLLTREVLIVSPGSATKSCIPQLKVGSVLTRLGEIPRATVEPPTVYSSISPQPISHATLPMPKHKLLLTQALPKIAQITYANTQQERQTLICECMLHSFEKMAHTFCAIHEVITDRNCKNLIKRGA